MAYSDSRTRCMTSFVYYSVVFVIMASFVSSNSWDFLLHSRGQDIGHVSVKLFGETGGHNLHKRSPIVHNRHPHDDDDDNDETGDNTITRHHDNGIINNNNNNGNKHVKHHDTINSDDLENTILTNRREFYRHYKNYEDDHNGDKGKNNDGDDNDNKYWQMPPSLTFTFNLHGEEVTLRLKKNEVLSSSSPPLYLVHDGVLVKSDDVEHKKRPDMRRGKMNQPIWGLYTDPNNGASVMVSAGPASANTRYLMTGTYFRDGQEYSIRPIVGRNDGTADHVISRLFQEANLLHDVIDLDQESSFVASMTSINDFVDSDGTQRNSDGLFGGGNDYDDANSADENMTGRTNDTATATVLSSDEIAKGDNYNRRETAPTTTTATATTNINNRYTDRNNIKYNESIDEDINNSQNKSSTQNTTTYKDNDLDSSNSTNTTNTSSSSSTATVIKHKMAKIISDIEQGLGIPQSLQELLKIVSEDEHILDFIENFNDSDISDFIANKNKINTRYLDLFENFDGIDNTVDDSWSEQMGDNDRRGKKGAESEEEVEDGKSDGLVGDGEKDGGRTKRQAVKKYELELLIVIDYGVYEVWFNGVTDKEGAERKDEAIRRIKQFYSFVINGVDLRYKSVNAHADYTIDVTWAGIIIFDTPDPTYWAETPKPPTTSRDFVESSSALEAFRAWAERQGQALPPSDHVMLFTGHNLTYGGSVSNAGLAYLGSACNPDYFFSIVEEYFEFRDVAIAAHELGHSLGARHDMDGNTCLSFNRFIMTPRFKFPSRRKAQNPWLFSPCSVSYFTDFIQGLDKNDTNCFVTRDAEVDDTEIQPFLVSLPGEVYSGDDFCRIGSGPGSYICRSEHIQDYQTTCYRGLQCYDPAQKKCVSKLPPNGMPCGNRKWCMNGTCKESNMAPATSGDDCPFGDDPGLIGGKTCAERMLTSRYDCYRDTFRARCCASCRKYRRNLPGCEYGDQFELCKKDQCVNYEEEYARDNCCDTCADLLFTIPTTVATTAPPTTLAPPTTSATPEVVVVTIDSSGSGEGQGQGQTGSGNGNGNGKGEGDGSGGENERVFPPEGGDKTKGERNSGRRKYFGSDESGDSDETRPRYRYMSSRERGGERSSWNRNRKAYGRMVQIQNLLQRMRESREDDRLQRLRLLIYLLDRTAGSRLASVLLGGGGDSDEEEEDD